MSKLIPLHNRKGDVVANAIVDDADFEWLSQYRWHMGKRAPCTSIGRKQVPIQNMIMSPADGLEVDHRDHNTLNNERLNLRICTHAQNLANRRKFKNGKDSQYKGVVFKSKQWKANITVQSKTQFIGSFTSELEAAHAYDAAAIKHFGEFARLNFPQEAQP